MGGRDLRKWAALKTTYDRHFFALAIGSNAPQCFEAVAGGRRFSPSGGPFLASDS